MDYPNFKSGMIVFSVISGAVAPILVFLYGDSNFTKYSMLALVVFIFLDLYSGTIAAKKDHSYGSVYGIDGLKRTVFMMILPIGGNFIDQMFGLSPIFFGLLVGGLIYHTIQSIVANSIRAGWGKWIPTSLLEKIAESVSSEIDRKLNLSVERKKHIAHKDNQKDDTTTH